MTTEPKPGPRWKRALWFALKTYAVLCTLLFTAYLGLVLWSYFFPTSSTEESKTRLEYACAQYKAREAPKRESYFSSLAQALAARTKDTSVPVAELFKYLGKPDLFAGTVERGTMAYIFHDSGITNRYVMYVAVENGRLTQIGFNEASTNNLSGFQEYPR